MAEQAESSSMNVAGMSQKSEERKHPGTEGQPTDSANDSGSAPPCKKVRQVDMGEIRERLFDDWDGVSCSNAEMKERIPLAVMIDYYVGIWEQEGKNDWEGYY
mmetsp:Transcript_20532/g.38191  ORF Transcript_20532/g.38191 Transcript_20532/m.38191 type:complete len:103 (+) Transcript_20532:26-334(+)